MKICYAVLHYDRAYAESRGYLARTPIHREIPREMARLGHEVKVVHLFPTSADFEDDGVRYRFVASGPMERSLARVAGAVLRRDPALYEPAFRAIRTIQSSKPDIIHFHSVTLHWNLWLLLLLLGRNCPPVVLHFHGGYPARNPLARAAQQFCFARASRLLFTTRAHAEPFVRAGMLGGMDRVEELMETSSSFVVRPRAEARRETGMSGHPVFLWAGRLHPIKDPFTALRGFERILAAWPDAHLYLHYLTDELLPALRGFVEKRSPLASHVHFQGRAPFEQMETIYNGADFLLQASLREFSGCAVLEAMACGVIPVATDIPSFRAMTEGGRYGVLFPVGDDEALARGVLAIDPATIPERSIEVRAQFERALGFPALARRLDGIYREILALGGLS
jgi:glycosyltransferase involved in cell wall biosynthesis